MNGLGVDLLQVEGTLVQRSVSPWEHFSGKGMHFDVQSYDFEGCANVSLMQMKAMGGLMRMDSLILTPYGKDAPLFSFDAIHVLWRHVVYVELFDTQLAPIDLSEMEKVKAAYNDLPQAVLKPHWYDDLHLSPSCFKQANGKKIRMLQMAHEMLKAYLPVLKSAPVCDKAEKTAKNSVYVEGLISNGGPAVDTLRNILGDEPAKELVRNYIFRTK